MKIAIHIDGIGSGATPTRIGELRERLVGTIEARLEAEAESARQKAPTQPRAR